MLLLEGVIVRLEYVHVLIVDCGYFRDVLREGCTLTLEMELFFFEQHVLI